MLLIEGTPLNGELTIIASKSLSHRYLIAAALSEGTSTLHNLMDSDDITATVEALTTLGARINLPVVKGPLNITEPVTINAKASGSTLRFLIPVALRHNQPVLFKGEHRLPERPLDVYEQLFSQSNVVFKRPKNAWLPLSTQGPLQGGRFSVRGDVSSQFISGLMFAAPLLDDDTTIEITNRFESKSYVDLTVNTLKDFGIEVTEKHKGYHIKGSQAYNPVNKTIEGDYSQAAFFIVAGLFNDKPIKIKGLAPKSAQGDAKVLDIVKTMGGRVFFEGETLVVEPSKTQGTDIDLQDIPDLGPILMLLAAFSEGKSTFVNVERLRLKESDRVAAASKMLSALNVEHTVEQNRVTITGKPHHEGDVRLDPYDDHRMAMSAIIASLKVRGTITLLDETCINKSYPTFIDTCTTLGLTIKKEASS